MFLICDGSRYVGETLFRKISHDPSVQISHRRRRYTDSDYLLHCWKLTARWFVANKGHLDFVLQFYFFYTNVIQPEIKIIK